GRPQSPLPTHTAPPPRTVRGKVMDDVPGAIKEKEPTTLFEVENGALRGDKPVSGVLPASIPPRSFQVISPVRGWVLVDATDHPILDEGGFIDGSCECL